MDTDKWNRGHSVDSHVTHRQNREGGGNPFELLALGEASGRAASGMSLEGQGWRHRRGFRPGEP